MGILQSGSILGEQKPPLSTTNRAPFQPTSSQRIANAAHVGAQQRTCGGLREVATVQPKRERLPVSDRGTLAAVMPENHGVPGSNPGPAT